MRACLVLQQRKRTLERALPQIELRDVVAELADVARQREARVFIETDLAALCRHANELERQLACVIRFSQHDSRV